MPLSSPIRLPLRLGLGALSRRRVGVAPPFDPATLFGVDDRGGVYDYTRSDGLFQLSTASGAVAEGDPIGYVSDLGPIVRPALQATAANRPLWSGMPRTLGDELVNNGRFVTDTVWTKGAGWTINTTAQRAEKTAGTASVLSQSLSLTAGRHYQITCNITRTAGTVLVRLTGGTTVSGVSRNAAGSYLEVLVCATGNTTIEYSADASFAGSVDNVSCREVASFVARGGRFDGTNDRLQTAAIDLSNSDKATVVWSCYYDDPVGGNRTPFDFGNYYANTPGSITANYASAPSARMRADTAQGIVSLPGTEGKGGVPVLHVNAATYDIAGATLLEEIQVYGRGVQPTNTASGSITGGGNLANAAFTMGSPANSFIFWRGLIHRFFLINRILNGSELAQVVEWVRAGMVFGAVIGDSTVGFNNAAVGLSNATSVSSLVGGLVTGAADISVAGHRIADQKTAWTNLLEKTALRVVFVQIGLNDVRIRVGGNTATTAQVIADYQDLIDTINADKPSGCRVYVSQMTPCKAWLDGATNPAAAYAAWQDLNEAIAGGGATPITGVDGRITSHVAALSDGSDNLNPIYDHNGDGVHESNEARFVLAQAWRAQLEADGLV